MSSSALPYPVRLRARVWLVVLALWLAAAVFAGLARAFTGTPPLPLGVAALAPVLAFLVVLAASPAVRRFVRSLDLKLLTFAQTWRIIGGVFVALWAAGRLPAGFALPAGLGDLFVGVTAPLVALRVVPRLPARLGLYGAWTAFGILDLIAAVSLGVVHSGTGPGTTAPMGTLPLSIIPSFLVPLAMILHLAAAYQALAGSVETR